MKILDFPSRIIEIFHNQAMKFNSHLEQRLHWRSTENISGEIFSVAKCEKKFVNAKLKRDQREIIKRASLDESSRSQLVSDVILVSYAASLQVCRLSRFSSIFCDDFFLSYFFFRRKQDSTHRQFALAYTHPATSFSLIKRRSFSFHFKNTLRKIQF